jgi:hypothetical protein
MTWEIAAVGLAAGGAAVGGYSAYQQGKTQREMNEYNAALAESEAEQTEEAASYTARLEREKAESLANRRRALWAKAGVVYTGTPLEVEAVTSGQTEMDIMINQRRGNITASRLRGQSVLDRFRGRQAYKQGVWTSGATILSGGATAAYYGREL